MFKNLFHNETATHSAMIEGLAYQAEINSEILADHAVIR